MAQFMGLEPEKKRPAEDAKQEAQAPSEGLSAPGGASIVNLHDLSRGDQLRLLTNLSRINSAIETFGETIAKTVIPTLTRAVQAPPGETAHVNDSITKAIANITNTVAELSETIDWFIRVGNEPLRTYRDLVETGTKQAIRLLNEVDPSGDDERWRIKVHTATLLVQQAISDDCEVITPNLLLMIKELERLLGK
jgi:hypothetical protein